LAAPAVQERFHLRRFLVPARLERAFPGALGGPQVAVADHLHRWDVRDRLADQLEDRAAEVAGDPPVGARTGQVLVEDRAARSGRRNGAARSSHHWHSRSHHAAAAGQEAGNRPLTSSSQIERSRHCQIYGQRIVLRRSRNLSRNLAA